jgi:hypothetical protein
MSESRTGHPWSEAEIRAAIRAYFSLLEAQEAGESVNKAALYRDLASGYPGRSAKSFELKFQNISAILYEQKLPYADGLKPKPNYQGLLRCMVLDFLDRADRPVLLPFDILVRKLKRLARSTDFLPVVGKGTGRFGLTLEHHLRIPPNSSKQADFMGIELKAKRGQTSQTLFSRVPTRYLDCLDKRDLLDTHGYYDAKRNRRALSTSFSSHPDTLGFALKVRGTSLIVTRGATNLLLYDAEVLEAALLTKLTEAAFVSVTTGLLKSGREGCRFDEMVHCKWPSILRFLRLAREGRVYLDLTLSESGGKVRDHGFLWRIPSESLPELYLHSERINLG